jgi:predicted phosphodiesterase
MKVELNTMRIAVIADIHSNSLALEAVLEDIETQQVDEIVHLGDAFNGPIDPAGVARLIRPIAMVHVRGNGERMVLAGRAEERTRSATYARERLDASTLDWVATWPFSWSCEHYFACHATPASDVDYLVEELVPGGWRFRKRGEIGTLLTGLSAPLVLCGHTHVPQFVRVDERRAILNPGSVGLPAYKDTKPIPHAMQAGTPDARYAVVQIEGTTVRVSHRCVPYDHMRAAGMAEQAGFAEWVPALTTGYAE